MGSLLFTQKHKKNQWKHPIPCRLHEGHHRHGHVHVVHPNLPELKPPQSNVDGPSLLRQGSPCESLYDSILFNAHRYVFVHIYIYILMCVYMYMLLFMHIHTYLYLQPCV